MKEDPFQAQRKTKKENRNKILKVLSTKGPATFTQLKNEVGLSKPVLSSHLKDLKGQGDVERAIENDKIVYKLTEQAFQIPSLRRLYYEIFLYHQILRELFKEKEAIIISLEETVIRKYLKETEKLLFWDLKQEFLTTKPESELVKALDTWLTPIILYTIVQELKANHDEWTKSISGLIARIMNLIRQKDVTEFEKALISLYSNRTSGDTGIPVIDCLKGISEQVERRKQVYDHFSEVFNELK